MSTKLKQLKKYKISIQYKGYTINYLRGEYRADTYAGPQFSGPNISKLKKQIREYLKPSTGRR